MKEQARRESDLIVQEAHAEGRRIAREAAAEKRRLEEEIRKIRALLRAALESLDGEPHEGATEAAASAPAEVEEIGDSGIRKVAG
jgi:cell division septum initiation protein DivIVA